MGGAPTGIAFARGSAWVATNGTLVRIDGSTGAVRERIPVPPGGDYRHVAITGGSAWLTDGGGRHAAVTQVDLATRRVRHVTHVVCCAIGVVARGSDIWVTVPRDGPGLLVRIDARSGRVVARIPVGSGPGPIAATASRIWVWNTSAPTSLMGIDPATNRVAATVALPGVLDIAAGPGGLWATGSGAGIVRLDPLSGQVVRRIASAVGARDLAVGRSGVYTGGTTCAGCAASFVARTSIAGGHTGPRVPVGAMEIGLALGAGALWVANFDGGTVTRIATHGGQ